MWPAHHVVYGHRRKISTFLCAKEAQIHLSMLMWTAMAHETWHEVFV